MLVVTWGLDLCPIQTLLNTLMRVPRRPGREAGTLRALLSAQV